MASKRRYKGSFPLTDSRGKSRLVRLYVALIPVERDLDSEGRHEYAEGDDLYRIEIDGEEERVEDLGEGLWVISSTGEELRGTLPAIKDLIREVL